MDQQRQVGLGPLARARTSSDVAVFVSYCRDLVEQSGSVMYLTDDLVQALEARAWVVAVVAVAVTVALALVISPFAPAAAPAPPLLPVVVTIVIQAPVAVAPPCSIPTLSALLQVR